MAQHHPQISNQGGRTRLIFGLQAVKKTIATIEGDLFHHDGGKKAKVRGPDVMRRRRVRQGWEENYWYRNSTCDGITGKKERMLRVNDG